MRFKSLLFLLCFVSTATLTQTRKVVIVIADGIPADVIEKRDLPNIHQVSNKDVLKERNYDLLSTAT